MVCVFSVITTGAGELVRPVHDRMPAILNPADEEAWLDPSSRQQDLLQMLRPHPGTGMEIAPV